jgi:hypothetical protein
MKVTKTESRSLGGWELRFGMSPDLNEVELERIRCPE